MIKLSIIGIIVKISGNDHCNEYNGKKYKPK
jgi:hypothetical protein